MLTHGEFTEILVLEVSVDLSLFGIGLLFKLKLSLICLAILVALIAELGQLGNLVLNGSQILVGVIELTLEIGILGIELINALFEVFNSLSLIKGDLNF